MLGYMDAMMKAEEHARLAEDNLKAGGDRDRAQVHAMLAPFWLAYAKEQALS